MNYTTTSQAADYIYDVIEKVDSKADILDKKNIKGVLEEEILDRLEQDMTVEDIDALEKNDADPEFFDKYLSKRFRDYQDILTDIVNDIVSDYILNE